MQNKSYIYIYTLQKHRNSQNCRKSEGSAPPGVLKFIEAYANLMFVSVSNENILQNFGQGDKFSRKIPNWYKHCILMHTVSFI